MAFCLPWEMNTRLDFGSNEGETADGIEVDTGTAVLPLAVCKSGLMGVAPPLSSSASCSGNAGVAVGAGTPGESRLTNGPVGVSRMMPAYLPFALMISRADSKRSGRTPRVLRTLLAIASLGNLARR